MSKLIAAIGRVWIVTLVVYVAMMFVADISVALRAKARATEVSTKPQAATAPAPGTVVTNALGMKFAYVPPGEYVMGSPAGEAGRHDDEIPHQVRISRPFCLGVTEVTQAQWQAAMGVNRSQVKGDNLPVAKISWADAVAFCRKLSEKDGRHRYRLPTEAEWEYACRAGAVGPIAGTGKLDEMAWHMDNSDDTPHAVGAKKPNAWGLYDMHGNVMEWCSDWYGPYAASGSAAATAAGDPRLAAGGTPAKTPQAAVPAAAKRDTPTEPAPAPAPASASASAAPTPVDPAGPAEGKYRVARGGSFGHFARACRSAARASFNPAYQLDQLGLRVAMEIDPNEPRR